MSKTKNVTINVAVAGFRTVVTLLMGVVPVFNFRCVPSHCGDCRDMDGTTRSCAELPFFSVTCAQAGALTLT